MQAGTRAIARAYESSHILSRVIKVGHECSLRPIFWIPVAMMRWIGVGKAMLVLGSLVANYLVRNLYS